MFKTLLIIFLTALIVGGGIAGFFVWQNTQAELSASDTKLTILEQEVSKLKSGTTITSTIAPTATTPSSTPTTGTKPNVDENAGPATGTIEGTLSYPAEGIPKDMKVCAIDQSTNKETCTSNHLVGKQYTTGVGYKLQLLPGKYAVYASVPGNPTKAFYSEFVTCGLNASCLSHKPILVTVTADKTLTKIDPQDWYVP